MDDETPDGTTVVVIPAPSNEGTDTEPIAEAVQDVHEQEVALDHEGRLASLETQMVVLADAVAALRTETVEVVEAVVEAAGVAQATADLALTVADDAQETASEADVVMDEMEEPESEPEPPDTPPDSARVHPWFRERKEWSK